MISNQTTTYLLKTLDKDIALSEEERKPFCNSYEAYTTLRTDLDVAISQLSYAKLSLAAFLEEVKDNSGKESEKKHIKDLKDLNYAAIKRLIQVNTACYKTIKMIKKGIKDNIQQGSLLF